jgi:hypothetical protein
LIRQVIAKASRADADAAIGPQAAAAGSTSTGFEVACAWLVDGITDASHSTMPNVQIDHRTQSITSRQAKPPQPGSCPPVFRLLIAPGLSAWKLCSMLLCRLSRSWRDHPSSVFQSRHFPATHPGVGEVARTFHLVDEANFAPTRPINAGVATIKSYSTTRVPLVS